MPNDFVTGCKTMKVTKGGGVCGHNRLALDYAFLYLQTENLIFVVRFQILI